MDKDGRVLLLVGSPRGVESTSYSLGAYLLEKLREQGLEASRSLIYRALRKDHGLEDLVLEVDTASLLILAFPLYIDSLPAAVIRVLEEIAAHRKGKHDSTFRRFMAICNCGFPESKQIDTALAICRRFAKEAEYEWAGGLALGGGEAIHGKPLKEAGGMVRHVRKSLELAASALAQGATIPEESVNLMAQPMVPAWIYRIVGDFGWKREARKYGVAEHLNDRPYE